MGIYPKGKTWDNKGKPDEGLRIGVDEFLVKKYRPHTCWRQGRLKNYGGMVVLTFEKFKRALTHFL